MITIGFVLAINIVNSLPWASPVVAFASDDACGSFGPRWTGGTCAHQSCYAWRGETYCVSGKCMCRQGYYAAEVGYNTGYCKPCPTALVTEMAAPAMVTMAAPVVTEVAAGPDTCQPRWTGGTCAHHSCYAWRGNTYCVSGKCMCVQGYYAAEVGYNTGHCMKCSTTPDVMSPVMPTFSVVDPVNVLSDVSGDSCGARWTGGTCAHDSCYAWRGDTYCVSGKCMCRQGYYATEVGYNTGYCKRCPAYDFSPVVTEVAVDPVMVNVAAGSDTCGPHWTGGTCSHQGCYAWRGETYCVSGKCMCKAGYYAAEVGYNTGYCKPGCSALADFMPY